MRKTIYTIGSIIVFVIAAFVFIALPAFSSKAQEREGFPPLGKYNGQEIKYEQDSDFANFYQYYAEPYQRGNIDLQTQLSLYNNAFDSTVQKLAYTQEVEKSGYAVPDSAVARTMLPYFSDKDGNYSPKLYKQTPQNEIEKMQRQVYGSLMAGRYSDDLFGVKYGEESTLYGLKPSSKESDFLSNFGNAKRAFNGVVFNMEEYPDSEKVAYGKSNEEKFVKYNMSVITIETKPKAQSLFRRIENSEISFKDAVASHSATKPYSDSDGKLTMPYEYELEKIIKYPSDFEALKSLSVGETSKVIDTETGFSIFHVDEEKIVPDFSNDDTLGDVYDYLTNYEFGHIEDYYTARANDFIASSNVQGFQKSCAEFGLKSHSIAAFPINYGSTAIANSVNVGVQGLEGVDRNEHFLKTAFSLSENEVSTPIVNGRSLIVLQMLYETNDAPLETKSFSSEIKSFDSSSLSSAIKNSPKLENNVLQVFIKYFLNNE